MQKEIRHTWRFDQPVQEVWEYLTDPALLEQWLMKSDFQPVVGHKFHFIGGCIDEGHTAARCEVLEVIPHSRLVYSWQTNSLADARPFDSTVVWTLIPKDNGTELQLLHTGFRAAEDVLAHNDGWTRIGHKMTDQLNALKQ